MEAAQKRLRDIASTVDVEKDGAGRNRKQLFRMEVALWLFAFVVFLFSPVIQMTDSKYSMLTAESLLYNHTFDLSSYKIRHFKPDLPFNTIRGHNAYQLQMTNGHKVLYFFSLGTSVLSVPAVAAANLFGISAATPDGRYNLFGAIIIQRTLASFLMAVLAWVFFRTASLLLSPAWSMLVAVGGAFGTQVWSTASRGMWSHTWEILLGGIVAYMLLSGEKNGAPLRPILLATLLSWMFFVRPTGAVPIFFVTLYVLLFHTRSFVAYALTGAFWLAVFIWIWVSTFGTPLPVYYAPTRNTISVFWIGLLCNLVSPSRGLFVYVPVVAFVLYLTARYWRAIPHRRLAVTSLLTIAVLTFTFATHRVWWNGQCYGPRFFADALPWFYLLAVLGCAAIPEDRRTLGSNPMLGVGAVLLVLSIGMNARGALSWDTAEWNGTRPLQLQERVFDWSQPQFLAGWVRAH